MSKSILEKYKDYIKNEKGLSHNTQEAYIRDLLNFLST